MRRFINIRKIITAVLAAALVIIMTGAAFGAGETYDVTQDVWTVSDCVYMADISGEKVFYEKNAFSTCYPASTIKALTCLLAVENCSMDETVFISERAVDLEEGYTMLPAYAGEEMSMEDCLYAMMVMSANECANAIAEHVAGSVEAFADMMNERAEQIGCMDSHFVTPYGGADPYHYSTAYDMYLIAREAFDNPVVAGIAHTREYVMAATDYSGERYIESKNQLLNPDSDDYNPFVIASKSGNLETGRCLITLAEINGVRVVISCMHSGDYYGVFSDTDRLLDYVYENVDLSGTDGPSAEETASDMETEPEAESSVHRQSNPSDETETAAEAETTEETGTSAETESVIHAETVRPSVEEHSEEMTYDASSASSADEVSEETLPEPEGQSGRIWLFIAAGCVLAGVCATAVVLIRRRR